MATEEDQIFSIEKKLNNPEDCARISAEVIYLSLDDKDLHLDIFDDTTGGKKERFLAAEGLMPEDIGIKGNLFIWSITVLSLLNTSGDYNFMSGTPEQSQEFMELIGKCLSIHNCVDNDFTKEQRGILKGYLNEIIEKNRPI